MQEYGGSASYSCTAKNSPWQRKMIGVNARNPSVCVTGKGLVLTRGRSCCFISVRTTVRRPLQVLSPRVHIDLNRPFRYLCLLCFSRACCDLFPTLCSILQRLAMSDLSQKGLTVSAAGHRSPARPGVSSLTVLVGPHLGLHRCWHRVDCRPLRHPIENHQIIESGRLRAWSGIDCPHWIRFHIHSHVPLELLGRILGCRLG